MSVHSVFDVIDCAEDSGDSAGSADAADCAGTATGASSADGLEVVEQLIDFESGTVPEFLETDGASVELVAATDGGEGGTLEILFPATVYEPTVRFRPDEPWDWSGHGNIHLAVDASNAGDESVQMYMAITDASGATTNRSVNIAVGEANTYYFVVADPSLEFDSGLREDPPPWETTDEMFIRRRRERHPDLSAIAEIALSARGIMVDKRVVVENFRLRRNPEHDLSYLEGIVDEFGQNAKQDFPIKVHSEAELVEAAESELQALAASGPLPDRSRYGGWLEGPRLDATGYFRTEKVNDKWWLVDPDGYCARESPGEENAMN